MLKCIIPLKSKFPTKCNMCGKLKVKSQLYRYIGQPAVRKITPEYPTTFIICEHCAMREEFGSKWKQNKKYKRWKESP